MQLKAGVSIAGIQPEIVLALVVAASIFPSDGGELMITSAVDGDHMVGSLHYVGAAVDIRYPTVDIDTFVVDLMNMLGSNYDVVRERTHLHIEFQPKHGAN